MASVFMPPISHHCSHISLGWDGIVSAHCGKTDAGDLSALKTAGITAGKELERVVVETVGQAWQEFRNGNPAAAEAALGEPQDTNVFVVPPARARSMRWWRIFIGASVVLILAGMTLPFWRTPWMDGLKPVRATEAEVRAFMNDTTPNPDPNKYKFNDPAEALFICLALPSTNLFSPGGLRAMRDEVAGDRGFDSWKKSLHRARCDGFQCTLGAARGD